MAVAVDGFRKPRSRTVKTNKKKGGPVVRSANRRVERGALGAPDIAQLQMERYAMWPLEVQQYARTRDAATPMWSLTHRWRPVREKDLATVNGILFTPTVDMQWQYDWPSAAAIYVYGNMGLREMAVLAGINTRRLFWASSRYGWAEQKGAYEFLREREEEHLTITRLDEAARTTAIRGTFTETGIALLRHCMAALNRSADSIEPRDIAPLMNQAIRLIGAGEKMPTEYRHSTVDNPNVSGGVTQNNVILSNDSAAALLASLAERARVLEDHSRQAAIPAVARSTASSD